MAVVASETRSQESLRTGIERWFQTQGPEMQAVKVDGLRSFSEGGLANEIWEVCTSKGIGSESYVLRLPPLGPAVFPAYDFAKEARLQNVLAKAGIGAVSARYEADPQWLGSDFLMMPKIAGRVPPAHPPYTVGGWLLDQSEDYRHDLMMAFTERLADLHRLDLGALDLAFVQREGGAGLRPEMQWWKNYLSWAAIEADAQDAEQVERGFEWCEAHCPATEPAPSLVWGDARIGNGVFGEKGRIEALLDWETATLAPAELDLGWHFAHRRNLGDAAGSDDLPELAGFPLRERQLERYAERLGRSPINMEWHELFGAVQLAICRLAVQSAARRSGQRGLPTTRPLRSWALRAMA